MLLTRSTHTQYTHDLKFTTASQMVFSELSMYYFIDEIPYVVLKEVLQAANCYWYIRTRYQIQRRRYDGCRYFSFVWVVGPL